MILAQWKSLYFSCRWPEIQTPAFSVKRTGPWAIWKTSAWKATASSTGQYLPWWTASIIQHKAALCVCACNVLSIKFPYYNFFWGGMTAALSRKGETRVRKCNLQTKAASPRHVSSSLEQRKQGLITDSHKSIASWCISSEDLHSFLPTISPRERTHPQHKGKSLIPRIVIR